MGHGEDGPILFVRSTLACRDEGERKRHEVKVMHLLYHAQHLRDFFFLPRPGINSDTGTPKDATSGRIDYITSPTCIRLLLP